MKSKPSIRPMQATNPTTDADLDRALATESDSILPSSGFADSVMTAVYREAAAPAPIPFPWKRALPGLAAILAAVVLLLVAIGSAARSSAVSIRTETPLWTPSLSTAFLTQHGNEAMWIAGSLVIPLACLFFCRKLIFPR